GLQLIGAFVPPLAADGTQTLTTTALKAPKVGTVVWGVAFSFSQTAANGSCTFAGTGNSFTDAVAGAKLSGTMSCDSSVDPSPGLVPPPNGKLSIKSAGGTQREQAFVRITYDDTDIVDVTGIVTKGAAPGASINGPLGFDPIIKSLVGGEQ